MEQDTTPTEKKKSKRSKKVKTDDKLSDVDKKKKPAKKKDPSEKKKPKKDGPPKKRITKTLMRAKYDVNSTNLDFDQATGKPLEDVILDHFKKMDRDEDIMFTPGNAYTIRERSKDILKSCFFKEADKEDGFHEPLSPEISHSIHVLENELFYRYFAFDYEEYFRRVKDLSVCLSNHVDQLVKDPTYLATTPLEELFPKLKSTVLDDFDSFLKEQFFKGERDIVCKNRKCRSSNVTYREIQMRGGDEPATIFVTCAVCGTEERIG